MPKFRKKPVVIEAMQLENNEHLLFEWLQTNKVPHTLTCNTINDWFIEIDTLEGKMRGRPGDWIIKGVSGEFYPCKPDIFEKTYELVEDEE